MQHTEAPIPAVQEALNDPLISTAQAALILGVTDREVRYLITRHELTAHKVGHDYRIRVSAIQGYLAAHCNARE